MGRLVGLDVGDVRIGVAVADELGLTAQGIGVVRRSALSEDFRQLETLLAAYPPERFVVGLPLNMDGTVGVQAEKTHRFAEALAQHFGVPIDTWDERLSTHAANRALIEGNVRRDKRKKVIDQVAAVLILQGYLDRPPGPRATDDDPSLI
jgi:putative Holliday junction resolvase